MSYNNNFSYYNGPSSNQEWWGNKDKELSNFDNRMVSIGSKNVDYGHQPYGQNFMPSYTQSMILPSENRPPEQIQPRHEVLQGTVTQLFSSFGYINDNIIFSKSDVSGPMVKVGDRVALDAIYQPNNPTKYKGERVCKLDESRYTSSGSLTNMKPLTRDLSTRLGVSSGFNRESKFDKKKDFRSEKKYDKSNSKKRSSASRDLHISDTKKSAKTRGHTNSPIDLTSTEEPKRTAEKKVGNFLKRKASSSSSKALKPSTEKVKSSPKPKIDKFTKPQETFALRELDSSLVKCRSKNIDPPNQFFHVSLKYQQTFPLNHPMKLGNRCHFKVMDKKVRNIDNFVNDELNSDIDPADADTTFSAKVMLLSTDELAEFYKQVLVLAEEFDGTNKVPATKAMKFLVGSVGVNEEFAFGGAWSPSLDGPDPDSNPRVLINTAIRTVRKMTGIDLSGCSSWPKFLELHYYRPLQKMQKKPGIRDNKAEVEIESEAERFEYIEPRMETVVYYIPDVWNCVPSQEAWIDIKRMYQDQLTSFLCPPPADPVTVKQVSVNNSIQQEDQSTDKSINDNQEEEDYSFNDNEENEPKPSESEISEDTPTHFSKINVDALKIIEIKKELELRKLNNKGVMEQLKARLKAALEKEESVEKPKDAPVVTSPGRESVSIVENVLSESNKKELKQIYDLPDSPHIIVHQNQKILDNQMKIKTMSLHSLLSYQNMKLEESTFEIALFAKQFLDMLRRDAAFNLYKCLVIASENDLSIKEENPAKKPKVMVTTSKRTINRPLLFSCSLLDREKSNKIPLDELRGLIEGLGICLSAEQLSTLLSKIKDPSNCLQYRVLTDKEVDDGDMEKILSTDQTDDLDYIKELSLGNKALFEDISSLDSVDSDEIDRLKNELDKSERLRQSTELRLAEIKEQYDKTKLALTDQTSEIDKLKLQMSDYRTKYHKEQDRGDYYKKDFDKIFRDLRDIDKIALSLGKCVTESLDRFKKNDEKPSKSKVQDMENSSSKNKDSHNNNKSSNKPSSDPNGLTTSNNGSDNHDQISEPPSTTSTGETSNICTGQVTEIGNDNKQNDVPVKSNQDATEKQADMDSSNACPEDFELSRPSDFEIIILDETE